MSLAGFPFGYDKLSATVVAKQGGAHVKTSPNLQDLYLRQVLKDRVPVVIYLVNGVQLRGTVAGFDSFTILLESDGKSDMIYKHAVSTISPQRQVQINWNDKGTSAT